LILDLILGSTLIFDASTTPLLKRIIQEEHANTELLGYFLAISLGVALITSISLPLKAILNRCFTGLLINSDV
jgi:hypothetical protein